jgi:hypothetical protein
MNRLLGVAEGLAALVLDVLTIPLLLLGLLIGMRGGARYFKMKAM